MDTIKKIIEYAEKNTGNNFIVADKNKKFQDFEIKDDLVAVGIKVKGEVIVYWGTSKSEFILHGEKIVYLSERSKSSEYNDLLLHYKRNEQNEWIPYAVTPIKTGTKTIYPD